MIERFSITFDSQTLAKLNKISKSMDRTRSDTLRQIVKEYNIK